jgi:acid phosphatase
MFVLLNTVSVLSWIFFLLTLQQAGLPAYWPYCSASQQMKSAVMSADGSWDTLQWRRRLEVFERQIGSAATDDPTLAKGSRGEIDAVCQPGELTDRGRQTTTALGQRLRDLYVSKLSLLPEVLDAAAASSVYLRSTPIPRALESTQQAFTGLYPTVKRSPDLPPPVMVSRSFQDETLYPNEGACKRFAELAKAFANRAAEIWNPSPELAYINKKIGKWMPADSPIVKVDSHPRLTGVMDTVNATLAHGSATKLPKEFYDEKLISNMDRICTEEWFAGYTMSNEYRKLGIGGLVGDIVQNMVKRTQKESFKLSLNGCHDTTLAATLASFGAYDVEKDNWPPYTSSIAVELFKSRSVTGSSTPTSPSGTVWPSQGKTWWSSLFSSVSASPTTPPASSTRKPLAEMSATEQASLDNHFVRLRYNDRPVTIPFCKLPGNHRAGDQSFCTLAAFKEAADSFTPQDWKKECMSNLGEPAMPAVGVEKPLGL